MRAVSPLTRQRYMKYWKQKHEKGQGRDKGKKINLGNFSFLGLLVVTSLILFLLKVGVHGRMGGNQPASLSSLLSSLHTFLSSYPLPFLPSFFLLLFSLSLSCSFSSFFQTFMDSSQTTAIEIGREQIRVL